MLTAQVPTESSRSIPAGHYVRKLLGSSIVPVGEWDALSPEQKAELLASHNDETLLFGLARMGLITPYQLGCIRRGETHTLVLGNYRILDKIGSGGMGVVFKAEHIKLRQTVAVKALFVNGDKNRRAVDRFFHEVLAVTRLKHPHIVAAVDAGEQAGAGPQGAPVPYLVMEYVEGRNLEDLVLQDGPLPIEQACLIAHQIADALTEAHRHDLIHRDIKPGNIIIAPDGNAKLLDFGVARLPSPDERMTKDGARLGTIGYMAPEQVRSAKSVDARADIFGLGASLYFTLTGRDPFEPPIGSAGASCTPSAREWRRDVSYELDAVIAKFMALNPEARVPTADAAMRELLPFLSSITDRKLRPAERMPATSDATDTVPDAALAPQRILIVDDQIDVRRVCRLALANDGAHCDEVSTGLDALEQIEREVYDLVLLDVDLPGCSGEVVLKKIRQQPPTPNIKVIMLSGRTSGDELSRMMLAGADDFLTKPFSLVQLRARTRAALKLKDAQDRLELLNQHLITVNAELERTVSSRDSELIHARGAMVLALAKLIEKRSAETGAHLIRLQKYSRVLAEAAARTPAFENRITPDFVRGLEDAAPLHDIGKAAIPDCVLNKPGRLDAQERLQMEAHTVLGADTLQEVARRYKFATGFLHMAIDLARHHHEKWDGTGYPDKLAGEEIPLAARLLAFCDVYDALRSPRVYKPALSHNMAVMTMCDASPGHFDPSLMVAFRLCTDRFKAIYAEMAD